jgi:hypothetical protein
MMPRLTDQEYRPFSPFGRGIGSLGSGLDQAFNPLKGFLSQTIAEEQVEPFVDEVKQMAQERFDLNGNAFQPQILQPRILDEISVHRERQGIIQRDPNSLGTINVPRGGAREPQIATIPRKLQIFQGFADGGPVMGGLGSFLASNLDEFGRNGDTEMIHATKSEVMMPKGMMDDPSVRRTVRDLFEETGRDMEEYTVGSGQMNVNPVTGYEEAFDLIGGIKDIFKKAAPFLLPAAVSFMFPGMSPFVSGALAGGVGSLLQGGDAQDALKGAAMGGFGSALISGLSSKGNMLSGFETPTDPTLKPDFEPAKASLSEKAGTVKDFFMKDKLTPLQAAGVTDQAAFNSLSGSAQAAAIQAANQSGGINYMKAIPAGLGVMALAGGFDPIEEDAPEDPYPYTTRELLEMYPERYRTGRIVAPIRMAAKGGEMDLENDPRMQKERMTFPRRQGYIAGPGTETSDDIPAMLSDGEFVMTARAVRGAGDGSREKGVEKMYDIMRAFEGGVVA